MKKESLAKKRHLPKSLYMINIKFNEFKGCANIETHGSENNGWAFILSREIDLFWYRIAFEVPF